MANLVHPLFVVLALLPWTWLTAAHFEEFSHGQGPSPDALSDSPANPYAAWLAGYGLSPSGEGGLEADPDDDGNPNAGEFAFGGNPVAPDGALMQIAVGGEDVIAASFVRRQGPYASATYLIEQSEDLRSGWTTYVPASMTVSTEGVADPVHYEHVEFTTPAGKQGFVRVKATIDLAPPQPDQSADPSPSSETTNVSTAPVLAWSASGAEVSYDVYLGLPGQMVFQTNQPTTVFAPDLLQHNTTYHWRVDTRNDYGVTTGNVWTFSTAVRPAGLTFLGAGEAAGGEGPVAPTLPEGLAPGDLLVLVIQSSGPRVYPEEVNGGQWLALARGVASPQSSGTGTNSVHLTAYYSRYHAAQGPPVISDSGNNQLAAVLAFRGVVSSGVPWDGVDGNSRTNLTTNSFAPGSATTVPQTLLIGAVATAGTNSFSAWTNAIASGMTNVIGRLDASTAAGDGGALGIATADFPPTGNYGRMNVELAQPAPQAMLSAALRPETPPGSMNGPWPANGAENIAIRPELRWESGPRAVTRDVYFGTSSPPPYRTSQSGTDYDPGALQPGTTYYWRVDEKNATGTTTGPELSFTTAPAGVVPDFSGMRQVNALAQLGGLDVLEGTVTAVFNDTATPGTIISQTPPAGSALLPGQGINWVRSRGPESGIVIFPNGPDLLGGEKLPVHRNLSLVTTHAGSILAFSGHRPNGAPDEDYMTIQMRRSTNGGETWGPVQTIAEDGMNRAATQVVVVLPSGRILMLWCWNAWIPSESDRTTRRIMVTHSDDDGLTWSPHRDITSQVYRENWRWYGLGPGPAFVKKREPHAGRLIIPARHGVRGAPGAPHIIYSDDGGETFQLGGELDIGNESTACEQSDGDILFNVRADVLYRWAGISSDGGLTFPVQYEDLQLPGADKCQASLLEHSMNPETGQANILFSNPDDLEQRVNGTIKLSERDGDPGTWVRKFRYSDPAPAFSGYSDIAVLNEAGDIGVIWEFGSDYRKPARWDGGAKFRAIRFDQINTPVEP